MIKQIIWNYWWLIAKKHWKIKVRAYLIVYMTVRDTASINLLWPNDAIWRYISGSILPLVMACCLKASSHYMKQSSLIISKVQWHLSECNFTRDNWAINHYYQLEINLSKLSLKSSMGKKVQVANNDADANNSCKYNLAKVRPNKCQPVSAISLLTFKFANFGLHIGGNDTPIELITCGTTHWFNISEQGFHWFM